MAKKRLSKPSQGNAFDQAVQRQSHAFRIGAGNRSGGCRRSKQPDFWEISPQITAVVSSQAVRLSRGMRGHEEVIPFHPASA